MERAGARDAGPPAVLYRALLDGCAAAEHGRGARAFPGGTGDSRAVLRNHEIVGSGKGKWPQMNHTWPVGPATLNHEKGLDLGDGVGNRREAVGRGSICVMARKQILPMMNQ